MFRDGDNRVRRGVGLTVKPTLLSLDTSIADVPIKQRRSEIQFDSVSFRIPHAICQREP